MYTDTENTNHEPQIQQNVDKPAVESIIPTPRENVESVNTTSVEAAKIGERSEKEIKSIRETLQSESDSQNRELPKSNLIPNETLRKDRKVFPIPSFLKKAATSVIEEASNLAYSVLGDRAPQGIRNHVPVYRAIERQYAGKGNQSGISEWTIGLGTEPKKHALNWVSNHVFNPNDPDTEHLKDSEEYVAIKSTLGKLDKVGTPIVRDYNSFGSKRLKVELRHRDPDAVVEHEIIRSNKEK